MVSIKLKLRISKSSLQEGTLTYQLIADRKVKLIATPYRLYISEWNEQLSRVIVSSNNRREYLLHVEQAMCKSMVRWRKVLLSIPDSLTTEEKFAQVTERFETQECDSGWFSFVESVIEELKANGQAKTAGSYQSTLRSFTDFRKGKDLSVESINGTIIKQYEQYLKAKGLIQNSTSFYMRILRAIYNRAVEAGLVTQSYPFKQVYTGVDKTVKRAVNKEVLGRLKRIDLSKSPSLQLSRDLFLFSLYARGMAYIDMAHLTQANIKGEYLVYQRRKTGQQLRIKIEPCIKEIIDRYANQTIGSTYLLPILWCSGSSFNYSTALRNHNRRLRTISDLLQLPNPLTSYVARHSWATLAKKNGVPLQTISEGMGHDNEATTRIYLASLDQSVIDDANAFVLSGI